MCPASDAAIVTPQARMVFEGRVRIKAACSTALCCTLVLPIPSHDCYAKPLLALLCSDVLATYACSSVNFDLFMSGPLLGPNFSIRWTSYWASQQSLPESKRKFPANGRTVPACPVLIDSRSFRQSSNKKTQHNKVLCWVFPSRTSRVAKPGLQLATRPRIRHFRV